MAANARAVGCTTTDKDRGVARAVAGAARTFLLDRLFRRAVHFRTRLGLVRTGLTAGELPAHGALQDVAADFVNAENRVVQLDLAGSLAGEGFN